MKEKYYITTSIPYANAEPHIGFAIEILYADVMARYHKLLGQDVYFLTGSDEHGQKMYRTAQKQGRDPFEYASEKSAVYQKLTDEWNICNDDFIRTTESRHMEKVAKFWNICLENGDIYKKKYQGNYCVGCELFIKDNELIDGKCPYHESEPELVEEENYFFRLSKYQQQLEKLYQDRSEFVFPKNRYNEMKQMMEQGLEDISISRAKEKLPWGIPVPNDDTQVMYVWFDALTNYLTALNWSTDNDELFQKYWPADCHVIGKDVNRFHTLLWPAMLMSAGIELPKQVAVHDFITLNGKRISKTLGNIINPLELSEKYPMESLRYFLMREIPYDRDGDFSEEKYIERYNADLANGLGNLKNRILVMIEKYSDGVVPEVNEVYAEMIKKLDENIWPLYNEKMATFKFNQALEAVNKFISYCDQLISDKEPWKMVKEGKADEVNDLLHHLAEGLRHIAIMIWPVMPETSEKILIQLGLDVPKEMKKPLSELKNWVQLTVGNKIKRGEALFPRLEKI